jgi:hypothetical protein
LKYNAYRDIIKILNLRRKIMKKLLCVLIAVSLFVLSACEKKEDVSQSEAKITDSSGIVQSEETEKTTKDDEFTIENGVLLKYMGDSKDVVIPDGVAKIGANAFESCESLTSVEISEYCNRDRGLCVSILQIFNKCGNPEQRD